MRKVWLCVFYAVCIFTIVFSLFWMALPKLPFPADSGTETPASEPGLAAQGRTGQGEEPHRGTGVICPQGQVTPHHGTKIRSPLNGRRKRLLVRGGGDSLNHGELL